MSVPENSRKLQQRTERSGLLHDPDQPKIETFCQNYQHYVQEQM